MTDSTSSMPAALVEACDVVVVPLQVVIDGVAYREGVDLSPDRLVAALRVGATVTTSQPGPEAFARVYARVAARGAREIVSVHLSGDLSSTVTSAQLAAQTAGLPVHVVDSRTVGMGLGFAVLAAARTAGRDRGPGRHGLAPSGHDVVRAAERCAAASSVLFAVDSLEHLRRGGRLGPVAAAVGTVLGLRPVLTVRHGRIEVLERARTAGRALERVIELTVADVAVRGRFDLAVHHLGQAEVAGEIAERLRSRCGTGLGAVHVAELSAVLGAHAGPGLIAVVATDASDR